MKWWPKACSAGDMIRVRVGAIWHYGIFVSENEVIEFGPPPVGQVAKENSSFRVMAVDVDEFSAGGIVECAVLDADEQKRRLPSEKTVALAREKVGEGGYDILHNNCEHFAWSCVFGVRHSAQEEELRQRWLSRPILDVYVGRIPEELLPGEVYPPEREAWIHASASERVGRERQAVWKLLEKGISRSFGLKMEELKFSQSKGKWSCDRLQFSLSHGGNVAVAAVSNGPVGVDVEDKTVFARRGYDQERIDHMAKKVCTAAEQNAIRQGESFLSFWTKKESIFKCYGEGGFFKKIDTAKHETVTREWSEPEPCVISVCGQKLERVRFFLVDENGIRSMQTQKKDSDL